MSENWCLDHPTRKPSYIFLARFFRGADLKFLILTFFYPRKAVLAMCDAFLGLPWRGVQGCRARSHFSHFSFFGMTGLCGHAHPCSSTILPQIPIKLDKAQGRITRARHDTINMSGGALTARLCAPPASYHSPGHTFFRILPGAPIGALCRTPLTGPRGLPMKKAPGGGLYTYGA